MSFIARLRNLIYFFKFLILCRLDIFYNMVQENQSDVWAENARERLKEQALERAAKRAKRVAANQPELAAKLNDKQPLLIDDGK